MGSVRLNTQTRGAVRLSADKHGDGHRTGRAGARQKQRFEEVYGGEVVTYAAQPEPDRKPWEKRPSLLDEAFEEEIRKEEKRQAEREAAQQNVS